MSSRVTRSSARAARDSGSSDVSESHLPSTTAIKPSANELPPPPSSRKRKAREQESEPKRRRSGRVSDPASDKVSSAPRSKKAKIENNPISPLSDEKGVSPNGDTIMANNGSPTSSHDEGAMKGKSAARPPPSKRGSSRNKQQLTDDPTSSRPVSKSRKGRKHQQMDDLDIPEPKESLRERADKEFSKGPVEKPQQSDRLPDPPTSRPPGEDSDADDPFNNSSFLRRHGGLSNSIRALSGMLSGTMARTRAILEQLRQKGDPSIQLIALQDFSELLLVSTEDNLAGMSPDAYVKELITLMQPDDFGESNPEIQLLACRCLANMMEALPASTAAIAYGGAVPILCQKLLEIEFIDLAEQALSTLEKVSHDFPGQIVREGGLTACLTYLDFFATSTQRTAVTTAANCCRNLGQDSFPVVRDAMPILLNVLNSSDQKVLEQGCLCVSRIVESFRYATKRIEELINEDMLRAILRLLSPGSTNLIGSSIQTQFLRVLALVARSSPQRALELLQMNLVDTLYQILTGVSPPSDMSEINSRAQKVIVMQALIHRPRDQVLETLNVISEVLPGIPDELTLQTDSPMRGETSTRHEMARSNLRQQIPRAHDYEARQKLLSGAKSELKHFTIVLLPTLVDAYSSTVNFAVRQKVFVAQLKILSNVDAAVLEEALSSVDYCSFLAAILSQKDHPLLVTYALQAAGLLMQRLKSIYLYQFYREGVIAEVENLAERTKKQEAATSSDKATAPEPPQPDPIPAQDTTVDADHSVTKDKPSTTGPDEDPEPIEHDEDESLNDDEENDHEEEDHDEDIDIDMNEDDEDEDDSVSEEEVYQQRRHSMLHPDDPAIAENARTEAEINRLAKSFLSSLQQGESEPCTQARSRIEGLTALMDRIQSCADNNTDLISELFQQLADYFDQDTKLSMTSFELMKCKVVDVLLDVLSVEANEGLAVKQAFAQAFLTPGKRKTVTSKGGPVPTAFSILIHQLQDVLGRAEHYEVITVHNGGVDGSSNSAASMLAKQIKLKLVASDDTGIPKTYRRFMVSIHAIATFKALEEFLRQRIALAERPNLSRARESLLRAMEEAGAFGAAGRAALGGLPDMTNPFAGGRPPPPPAHTETGAASSTVAETVRDTASSRTRGSSRKGSQPPSVPKPSTEPPQTPQPSGDNRLECADEAQLSDPETDDYDAALDALMDDMEDEMDEEPEEPSAVNMEVAPTGKVIARKEDGTRVATPVHRKSEAPKDAAPESVSKPLASSTTPRPSGTMSYAAAVQATPQDWHLEFSANGQVLTNDTTVYRAVHFNQSQPRDISSRNIWGAVHEITFKQVPGPPPLDSVRAKQSTPSPLASELPSSLNENPVTSGVLRLLGLMYKLNRTSMEPQAIGVAEAQPAPASQFVNTKLTAKLNRQLEEPLIVASDCLPTWSEDLARLYPFLFPFETRFLFLQSTSFGYSRSMNRWQGATQNANRHNRHRDERPYLGKPQRQKVRISRHDIIKAAVKVMELYGSSPAILEVEYFEEVGTGLGPTLEFYSTVSREFAKKSMKMWREDGAASESEYAGGPQGLFPLPMTEEQCQSERGKRVLSMFATLGKFVARSLIDSRIIDINFNPAFFDLSLNALPSSFTERAAILQTIDPGLMNSLQHLHQYIKAKESIEQDPTKDAAQIQEELETINVSVTNLALDFTLPGHADISLLPDNKGHDEPVTIYNLLDYIRAVMNLTMTRGVGHQFQAFRQGFSEVFPFDALRAFTSDELVMLFGRSEEDWTLETLMDSVKADHGFNLDSKSVRSLLQAMSEFSSTERRDFLQFVTGSPKLPIGGFKALTPMFTIVCKPSEAPLTSDDYLPSVMTCVNYLKLPDYSSAEVMKAKIAIAVKEGQGAFHLS